MSGSIFLWHKSQIIGALQTQRKTKHFIQLHSKAPKLLGPTNPTLVTLPPNHQSTQGDPPHAADQATSQGLSFLSAAKADGVSAALEPRCAGRPWREETGVGGELKPGVAGCAWVFGCVFHVVFPWSSCVPSEWWCFSCFVQEPWFHKKRWVWKCLLWL